MSNSYDSKEVQRNSPAFKHSVSCKHKEAHVDPLGLKAIEISRDRWNQVLINDPKEAGLTFHINGT